MAKFDWRWVGLSSTICLAALGWSHSEIALAIDFEPADFGPAELELSGADPIQFAQVSHISTLSDVRSNDWAFVALQRLVKAYGCLGEAGDRPYNSDSPAQRLGQLTLTRHELATDLNACLNAVIHTMSEGPDLDTLRRLQNEFAIELAVVHAERDESLEVQNAGAEDMYYRFPVGDRARGKVATVRPADIDRHSGVPFESESPSHAALLAQITPLHTVASLLSLELGPLVVAGHYAQSSMAGTGENLESYMGGIALPGVLGERNELGIYGGVSPAVDRESLLIEAYYKLNLNEFVTFTPALIYTDQDPHDGSHHFYGTLRATFSF